MSEGKEDLFAMKPAGNGDVLRSGGTCGGKSNPAELARHLRLLKHDLLRRSRASGIPSAAAAERSQLREETSIPLMQKFPSGDSQQKDVFNSADNHSSRVAETAAKVGRLQRGSLSTETISLDTKRAAAAEGTHSAAFLRADACGRAAEETPAELRCLMSRKGKDPCVCTSETTKMARQASDLQLRQVQSEKNKKSPLLNTESSSIYQTPKAEEAGKTSKGPARAREAEAPNASETKPSCWRELSERTASSLYENKLSPMKKNEKCRSLKSEHKSEQKEHRKGIYEKKQFCNKPGNGWTENNQNTAKYHYVEMQALHQRLCNMTVKHTNLINLAAAYRAKNKELGRKLLETETSAERLQGELQAIRQKVEELQSSSVSQETYDALSNDFALLQQQQQQTAAACSSKKEENERLATEIQRLKQRIESLLAAPTPAAAATQRRERLACAGQQDGVQQEQQREIENLKAAAKAKVQQVRQLHMQISELKEQLAAEQKGSEKQQQQLVCYLRRMDALRRRRIQTDSQAKHYAQTLLLLQEELAAERAAREELLQLLQLQAPQVMQQLRKRLGKCTSLSPSSSSSSSSSSASGFSSIHIPSLSSLSAHPLASFTSSASSSCLGVPPFSFPSCAAKGKAFVERSKHCEQCSPQLKLESAAEKGETTAVAVARDRSFLSAAGVDVMEGRDAFSVAAQAATVADPSSGHCRCVAASLCESDRRVRSNHSVAEYRPSPPAPAAGKRSRYGIATAAEENACVYGSSANNACEQQKRCLPDSFSSSRRETPSNTEDSSQRYKKSESSSNHSSNSHDSSSSGTDCASCSSNSNNDAAAKRDNKSQLSIPLLRQQRKCFRSFSPAEQVSGENYKCPSAAVIAEDVGTRKQKQKHIGQVGDDSQQQQQQQWRETLLSYDIYPYEQAGVCGDEEGTVRNTIECSSSPTAIACGAAVAASISTAASSAAIPPAASSAATPSVGDGHAAGISERCNGRRSPLISPSNGEAQQAPRSLALKEQLKENAERNENEHRHVKEQRRKEKCYSTRRAEQEEREDSEAESWKEHSKYPVSEYCSSLQQHQQQMRKNIVKRETYPKMCKAESKSTILEEGKEEAPAATETAQTTALATLDSGVQGTKGRAAARAKATIAATTAEVKPSNNSSSHSFRATAHCFGYVKDREINCCFNSHPEQRESYPFPVREQQHDGQQPQHEIHKQHLQSYKQRQVHCQWQHQHHLQQQQLRQQQQVQQRQCCSEDPRQEGRQPPRAVTCDKENFHTNSNCLSCSMQNSGRPIGSGAKVADRHESKSRGILAGRKRVDEFEKTTKRKTEDSREVEEEAAPVLSRRASSCLPLHKAAARSQTGIGDSLQVTATSSETGDTPDAASLRSERSGGVALFSRHIDRYAAAEVDICHPERSRVHRGARSSGMLYQQRQKHDKGQQQHGGVVEQLFRMLEVEKNQIGTQGQDDTESGRAFTRCCRKSDVSYDSEVSFLGTAYSMEDLIESEMQRLQEPLVGRVATAGSIENVQGGRRSGFCTPSAASGAIYQHVADCVQPEEMYKTEKPTSERARKLPGALLNIIAQRQATSPTGRECEQKVARRRQQHATKATPEGMQDPVRIEPNREEKQTAEDEYSTSAYALEDKESNMFPVSPARSRNARREMVPQSATLADMQVSSAHSHLQPFSPLVRENLRSYLSGEKEKVRVSLHSRPHVPHYDGAANSPQAQGCFIRRGIADETEEKRDANMHQTKRGIKRESLSVRNHNMAHSQQSSPVPHTPVASKSLNHTASTKKDSFLHLG